MTGNVLAPEAVAPLPGSAATAVAWRWRGQLHVTVIVKASFAFAPGADMPRIEPQPVVPTEVHHGKNPTRSVRFTSELAPYLGRADVLFTGFAEATSAPVQSMGIRVAVYTEQRSLLDKHLVAQDKAGFQRMPIVYERAARGADGLENPFGVDPSSGPPGIVDPAQPDRPAGFGPIARTWPTRKRLLGATPRKALDAAIAEIPEGFDWAYYQAAPLDQRTELLAGDEWILLEGLHPTSPRLQTRLPSARASARIFGLPGTPEGQRLELTADMLHIDGDEQRCTVVWRKSFSVAEEAALPALRIAAGVEIGKEALPWPDPGASWPSRAARSNDTVDDTAATLVVLGGGGETVALTFEPQMGRPRATLPFQPPSGATVAPSIVAREPAPASPTDTLALSSEQMPPAAPSAALPWGTLALAPEASSEPRARALPFRAPSPDPAPATVLSTLPQERVATDTLAILPEDDDHFSERAALPFSSADRAPPPAAPLEEAPSEVTPIQEIPIAAAPEIVNVAPPAPSSVEDALPASPWAPAPPAAPEPPRALPTPPPVLKQRLYGRFDRND